MITYITNASQIVTMDTRGSDEKRHHEMRNTGVILDHAVVLENGIITDFIKCSEVKNSASGRVIDAAGCVLLPGFTECHTHSAFAGNRSGDFKMRLSGKSYEEIAASGGGIQLTVNAVRNASFQDLAALLLKRINCFIEQGITTLEIKSGYGLDLENELKLLRVTAYCAANSPITIIPTFLGAHIVPKEFRETREEYIRIITDRMLPVIAQEHLAEFCDAFCEPSAFTPEEIDIVFSRAIELGLSLKLHSEQFRNIGGIDLGLRYQAVSIDHLEVIREADIPKIAKSDTVAVLLPGVSFYLHYGYAPARQLIDQGAAVALSTDYNPGSSPSYNLLGMMSLACLEMGMQIEEAFSAVTINAAKAVKRNTRIGSLELGKDADIACFRVQDYSEIVYAMGNIRADSVFKKGELIYSAP